MTIRRISLWATALLGLHVGDAAVPAQSGAERESVR
jgi:hypothetical protein